MSEGYKIIPIMSINRIIFVIISLILKERWRLLLTEVVIWKFSLSFSINICPHRSWSDSVSTSARRLLPYTINKRTSPYGLTIICFWLAPQYNLWSAVKSVLGIGLICVLLSYSSGNTASKEIFYLCFAKFASDVYPLRLLSVTDVDIVILG